MKFAIENRHIKSAIFYMCVKHGVGVRALNVQRIRLISVLINTATSNVKDGDVMGIKRVGNLTHHRLTGGIPQYLCLKWWHGYFFVLQDIVTGDYKTPLNINAEGMYKPCCNCTHINGACNHFISQNDCKLLSEFKNLWDSTIKKPDIDRYGWKANPWVWVIEFDRITEEMK